MFFMLEIKKILVGALKKRVVVIFLMMITMSLL